MLAIAMLADSVFRALTLMLISCSFCRSSRNPASVVLTTLVSLLEDSMKRAATPDMFLVSMAFAAFSAQAQEVKGCYAHHPQYLSGLIEVAYSPGCVGHDEP